MVIKMFDRFLPPDRRFNPEALLWVAVILAAIAMLAIESSIAANIYSTPVALAFFVTVIHAGSMPLAMLRPVLGAIFSIVACGALPLLGPFATGSPWPWSVPMMITQIGIILIVGLRAHWGVALAALIASIAVSAGVAAVGHFNYMNSRSDAAIVNIVVFSCIAGGTYVVAVIIQQWQHIRSELLKEMENSAEEHSKRVVVEERALIARELHDIVAHSMSIINIQASSAPFRHENVDDEVRKEFEDISVTARHALTEMRGLLSVLRNDNSSQELAPQPKFSEIEALVQKAQQAGVRVTLEWNGDPVSQNLRDSTSLAGYRIVQEALSNAIRHARESEVSITVNNGGTALWINVVNNAGQGPAETADHGLHRHQGLIGMRERAASVGGELRTGWTQDGNFEVVAVLPGAQDDSEGNGASTEAPNAESSGNSNTSQKSAKTGSEKSSASITAQPSTAQPSTAEPGTAQPSTAQPSTAQPGDDHLGGGRSSTNQPDANLSSSTPQRTNGEDRS